MTTPITPDMIIADRKKNIPDKVIEIFNEEIQKEWNGHSAVIVQNDIVKRLVQETDFTSDEIFHKGYFDIEDIFIKAGREVEYDKPSYHESYAATFIFRKQAL